MTRRRDFTLLELYARCVVTETGCWEWTGATGAGGYAKLELRGKMIRGHRLALALARGQEMPPPNVLALHACDNPPCINPEHLAWGDHSANRRDAYIRGRAVPPLRKLHPETRRQVRDLYSTGRFRQADLAALYGCTQTAISHAIRGVALPEGVQRVSKSRAGVGRRAA